MEASMRHRIPNRTASRRGNYSMTMGVLLPILIGFGALSVDISYINMARTQVQNVSDAASHAAYVGFRATPGGESDRIAVGEDAAEFVVERNLIGNQKGILDSLEFGEWDFGDRSFTAGGDINSAKAVVVRNESNGNELDLFFAPLLNYPHIDVAGMGTAAGRTRQLMLISDVSGSFANDIDKANDANVAFLDYMNQNPLPGDLLGHVIFSGTANYPDLHELASPLTQYASLKNEFVKLDVCYDIPDSDPLRGSPPETGCFTSQARGLHRALMEFIENGDAREFQGMILLTDGLANTFLEEDDNDNGGQGTAEDDAEYLVERMWFGGSYSYKVWECALGAEDDDDPSCGLSDYSGEFDGGVHLWTVYFGSNGANVSWLQSLTEIGPGNRGASYDTDDSSELEKIYIEIASSIPVVLTD
jgi:hypothetical protein